MERKLNRQNLWVTCIVLKNLRNLGSHASAEATETDEKQQIIRMHWFCES